MDIFTSINTALGIAKELKKWSDTIQDLEVKVLVSNLLSEMADIKVECASLKTETIKYEEKIIELQKQLNYKEDMFFDNRTGCMYKAEDRDKINPYCPKCLSEKFQLNNMQKISTAMGQFQICVVCKNKLQSV